MGGDYILFWFTVRRDVKRSALSAESPGLPNGIEPVGFQFREGGLKNGCFGHEDIPAAFQTVDLFDENGTEEPLGPVALHRLADLFAGDECDTFLRICFVEENEKRSVPDLVGSAVDRIEGCLLPDAVEVFYAANLFLPLARRALMILRPFLLFMRARKPWVLFRGVL